MARKPTDAGGGRLRIEATVLDVRKGDETPTLIAYAFTQSGRLLGRSQLKEGKAELPIPGTKEPEAVRVVIGPPIDNESEGEVLSALMRLGAPERLVRPEQIAELQRFPIDRPLWACWFRWCLVRGILLKRITTGGLHVDLPVCDAEVEIYEVDPVPVILPKIPDLVIDRIRDLVKRPWPPPPPPEERFPGGIPFPPVPPPGPGPDPAPFFLGGLSKKVGRSAGKFVRSASASNSLREEVLAIAAEMRGDEPADTRMAGREAMVSASAQALAQDRIFNFSSGEHSEVDPEEAMASVRALSEVAEIKSAANVSLSAFKASLLANAELFRPLLCWLWPQAVNMSLVATANTDECGKFRAIFYQGCSTDTPDLYFKAYRRIGFFRFLIYGPLPVACHTWWNYACGSEVTLITTSPFAQTCPPCQPVIAPPHWVLAMAVGNTSLASVRGTSQALQPTTSSSNIGLTSGGAPFGGYIRLRFEFDNTLRTDLNVRYYRVRWRKIGSGNPFVDLTEDVWRHYAHMVGTTLMIEPYKLGPQPVGATPNLYEIPPALPPDGQWSIPDAVVDTTSAAFPSASLAPAGGGEGDYQFELTLFDAAGNAVNATGLGINYVVPTTLDLTATIPTVGAGTLGLVTGAGRLVFQLHIDNNPCEASLLPPDISGSTSADPCGLLRYGPTDAVSLHWTAMHPNGFATYDHSVVKGATLLPISVAGLPVGAPPGVHNETHTIKTLLGSCTIAGFAETVSVWAMATDGWSTQHQYNDHAIQAFALAPIGA